MAGWAGVLPCMSDDCVADKALDGDSLPGLSSGAFRAGTGL